MPSADALARAHRARTRPYAPIRAPAARAPGVRPTARLPAGPPAGILAAQLILTAAIAAPIVLHPGVKGFVAANPWVVSLASLGSLVLILVLSFSESARHRWGVVRGGRARRARAATRRGRCGCAERCAAPLAEARAESGRRGQAGDASRQRI